MGQEEAASRTDIIKEEEFLVLSNLSVISLGGFFKELFVFLELLGIGEGDAVNSLQ